jgi:hypothetical protein
VLPHSPFYRLASFLSPAFAHTSPSPPTFSFSFSFPAMPGLNTGFASKPGQKKMGWCNIRTAAVRADGRLHGTWGKISGMMGQLDEDNWGIEMQKLEIRRLREQVCLCRYLVDTFLSTYLSIYLSIYLSSNFPFFPSFFMSSCLSSF